MDLEENLSDGLRPGTNSGEEEEDGPNVYYKGTAQVKRKTSGTSLKRKRKRKAGAGRKKSTGNLPVLEENEPILEENPVVMNFEKQTDLLDELDGNDPEEHDDDLNNFYNDPLLPPTPPPEPLPHQQFYRLVDKCQTCDGNGRINRKNTDRQLAHRLRYEERQH